MAKNKRKKCYDQLIYLVWDTLHSETVGTDYDPETVLGRILFGYLAYSFKINYDQDVMIPIEGVLLKPSGDYEESNFYFLLDKSGRPKF